MVRNVIVSGFHEFNPPNLFKEIISSFSGIENLHIEGFGLFVPSEDLDDLPLRHFYGDIRFDMEGLNDPLRHPGFVNMTHLELMNGLDGSGTGAHTQYHVLRRLPRLTHLSFDLPLPLPACTTLLLVCKPLSALILFDSGPQHPYAAITVLGTDPRFVLMNHPQFQEDWQWGVLTGEDFWARANQFIRKRRSGQIPSEDSFSCLSLQGAG